MNSSSELSSANIVCPGKQLLLTSNCFFLHELKMKDAEIFCFDAVSGEAFLCLVNDSLLTTSGKSTAVNILFLNFVLIRQITFLGLHL